MSRCLKKKLINSYWQIKIVLLGYHRITVLLTLERRLKWAYSLPVTSKVGQLFYFILFTYFVHEFRQSRKIMAQIRGLFSFGGGYHLPGMRSRQHLSRLRLRLRLRVKWQYGSSSGCGQNMAPPGPAPAPAPAPAIRTGALRRSLSVITSFSQSGAFRPRQTLLQGSRSLRTMKDETSDFTKKEVFNASIPFWFVSAALRSWKARIVNTPHPVNEWQLKLQPQFAICDW